jgi:hypothetical protein
MIGKLLRFGHSANYDVAGVGRALTFSIPVWVLGAKQTLDIKSIEYKPGHLGFIEIKAEIKDLPEPQHLSKNNTRDTGVALKHGIVE